MKSSAFPSRFREYLCLFAKMRYACLLLALASGFLLAGVNADGCERHKWSPSGGVGDAVLLKNAAKPGVCMPVVGLGTGHCNPTEGGECFQRHSDREVGGHVLSARRTTHRQRRHLPRTSRSGEERSRPAMCLERRSSSRPRSDREVHWASTSLSPSSRKQSTRSK